MVALWSVRMHLKSLLQVHLKALVLNNHYIGISCFTFDRFYLMNVILWWNLWWISDISVHSEINLKCKLNVIGSNNSFVTMDNTSLQIIIWQAWLWKFSNAWTPVVSIQYVMQIISVEASWIHYSIFKTFKSPLLQSRIGLAYLRMLFEMRFLRPMAVYTLWDKKICSDIREEFGIFNNNDKLTQYKINWREYIQRMDDNRLPKKKKIKLHTRREKKYRKTTNEMGRWFPGGRNRPRGLSLIVYDFI